MTKLKSIRLTNQVRDKILDDLLAKAFDPKEEKLQKRRFDLSSKVYNDVYTKKQRDKMQEMPEGWLPKVNSLSVQFGGAGGDVCKRQFPEGEEVLVPYKDKGSWAGTNILKVYDHSHKLTIEHDNLTDDIEEFKSQKRTTEAEARTVIYSANTTKALKEAWPQIAKIVEKYEPSEGSQNNTSIIPVTNSLNQKLGL